MNFHLLFVCWRSIALLLRVSKAWGKKKISCLYLWLGYFLLWIPSDMLWICFPRGSIHSHTEVGKRQQSQLGSCKGVRVEFMQVTPTRRNSSALRNTGVKMLPMKALVRGLKETIKWQRTVLNERKLQLRLLTEIKTNWKSSTRGSGVKGDTAWAWMYFCPWMCKGRKQTTAAAQKLFGTQVAMDTLQYITDKQSKTN